MIAPYLITDPKLRIAPSPWSGSVRDVSRGYFRGEQPWFYLTEAIVFAILAAVSLWPIVFAAEAICALPG